MPDTTHSMRCGSVTREHTLLRIFVDAFQKWHHRPVYEAIVEKAHSEELAGATALEGVEGFGQGGLTGKDHLWRLAKPREVIVEIVDSQERIEAFLEAIEPMLRDAVTTLERACVVLRRTRKGAKS